VRSFRGLGSHINCAPFSCSHLSPAGRWTGVVSALGIAHNYDADQKRPLCPPGCLARREHCQISQHQPEAQRGAVDVASPNNTQAAPRQTAETSRAGSLFAPATHRISVPSVHEAPRYAPPRTLAALRASVSSLAGPRPPAKSRNTSPQRSEGRSTSPR